VSERNTLHNFITKILNPILDKIIFITNFLKIAFIDCIGEFLMKGENMQKIVFLFIVTVIILILNPENIPLKISNIVKVIVGMFILGAGYNGTMKYRKEYKVGASVFAVIVGFLLVLWGLGVLNA